MLTVETCDTFTISDTIYSSVFQNQLSIVAGDNWFIAAEGRLEHG